LAQRLRRRGRAGRPYPDAYLHGAILALFAPEGAHDAEHVARRGAHLEVASDGEPADDSVAVQYHGGRARHVLAVRSAARVDQAIAPRHREIAVGEEA